MQEEVKGTKTTKISKGGNISIPEDLRKFAGLKEGDEVELVVYGNKFELRPVKENPDESWECMLASEDALSKNWLSKEDEEAWKDL